MRICPKILQNGIQFVLFVTAVIARFDHKLTEKLLHIYYKFTTQIYYIFTTYLLEIYYIFTTNLPRACSTIINGAFKTKNNNHIIQYILVSRPRNMYNYHVLLQFLTKVC